MTPTLMMRLTGLGLAAILAAPYAQAKTAEVTQAEAPQLPDSLPITRIQILGTHNS